MATQTRNSELGQRMLPLVVAVALVVGAVGGYGMRALAGGDSQARAGEGSASTIGRATRIDREGYAITPFQAPAPRWTHEDDVLGSATK